MKQQSNAPRAYAFFDVDDTVITIKSLLRFQEFWYRWVNDPTGRDLYADEMSELLAQDAPWEYVNRRYYAYFAGRSVVNVQRCVELWFAETEQLLQLKQRSLFNAAVVERLNQHRMDNVEPVFVSGSFELLLQPIAQRLQVNHVLAIQQQVVDGIFTGHILPPQTIGQGKVDAVREFLNTKNVDPAQCYAYGDDISDAPMLGSVGFPFVIRGGRRLEAYAVQRGWPVMDPC